MEGNGIWWVELDDPVVLIGLNVFMGVPALLKLGLGDGADAAGVTAALVTIISHCTECLMQLLHDGLFSSHLIFLDLQTRQPVRTFRCGLRDVPCMIQFSRYLILSRLQDPWNSQRDERSPKTTMEEYSVYRSLMSLLSAISGPYQLPATSYQLF